MLVEKEDLASGESSDGFFDEIARANRLWVEREQMLFAFVGCCV